MLWGAKGARDEEIRDRGQLTGTHLDGLRALTWIGMVYTQVLVKRQDC